jgi:tetratricopeptide (TPR) repeat protein
MEETRAWLAEHPQENVRIRAIGILIRNGLNETAIEMLTEAVHKIDTVIADSNIAILGQYLRLLGDKIDPETAMRLGHELSTANPSDKTELAHWLRDKGHIDAAERLYQEISRLTPEQTTGRMRRSNQYGYGKLLLSIGRPKEAEDQFRTVLNTHKGHWAARVGLANTLQKQGTQAKEAADPIQAEKFFKKAEQELESAAWWIKLNKMDMAPIYNKFGWLYIQMERYQEALDAFCTAGNVEGLEGNNFGRYWGIGKALTELHKFEHALSYLENALQEAGELKPPASEEISALIEICVVQQQRQILEQSN